MNRKKYDDLISVIIPVYNVEGYVENCVRSVQNQTYRNLEIILVDDGSKDRSGYICDKLAEKDERIFVIHQENQGLSGARNAGLEVAHGKYVAFVDADDTIYFEMYTVLCGILKQNNADIAVGGMVRTENEKFFLNVVYKDYHIDVYEKEEALMQLFYQYTDAVSACNKLYIRELFCSLRYPYGKLHEDEYITYQLLYRARRVVFVEEKMYAYMQRQGSIVHSPSVRSRKDKIGAYKEVIEFCKSEKAMQAYKRAVYRYLDFSCEYYLFCKQSKNRQARKELKTRIVQEIETYMKEFEFNKKNMLKFVLFRNSPLLFQILKNITDRLKSF
ncbi:MAG: glycosyltransferase [Lachnospiraceae bacterium]|nr:glycosyltransferase [Lachnospiraceae bacterium]